MSVRSRPLFSNWLSIEQRHSVAGILPDACTRDHQIYLAETRDCDARKATALALSAEADALLRLRANLFRGNLKEAAAIIEGLKRENLEPAQATELLLEQS